MLPDANLVPRELKVPPGFVGRTRLIYMLGSTRTKACETRCSVARAVGAIYQRCPVIGLLSLTGLVGEVGANPLRLYAQTPKGYEVEGFATLPFDWKTYRDR